MAVEVKEITFYQEQILNDYATAFQVDKSQLGNTYVVRANVQGAMIFQFYLALSDVQRNQFYDTAEAEQLVRFGIQILGRTPAPATSGVYTIQVTGQIGATIPAGTQFVANDEAKAAGFIYIVDNEKVLSSETDTLQIRALTAGTESLLFVDDFVTSTTPIANVDSEAQVNVVDTIPTAAESIESYRADVLEAARIEAQGGAPGDYRLWASDEPTVRTVYPYAKLGSAGDVEIYIEATKENTAPLEITGVPTQATIDAVYTKQIGATPESGTLVINPLTGKGRRPIGTFNIFPLPVSPNPVDLFFINLSDESIAPELKTVIDDLFYKVRPFIAGADILTNKNDILTISAINAVVANFLVGTGITYSTLTMQVNGITVNEFQFTGGNYPYLRIMYNDGSPI